MYLAGPYKGAPLSLAVITPAVSGPYDLGNVVIRAALQINPSTAQITAVSDPLPQILQGIPLRLRSVLINLDRPNFVLNPTNCDSLMVNAKILGDEGAVAERQSHFQVANCASLSFSPSLALRLSGDTKRAGNPGLQAVLTYPKGLASANIASTAVTLPRSELIDNAHIRNPCTRVQFAANACPATSVIGYAKAETPLLSAPLEGPVYLRSAPENKSGLPDVVAALNGQIDIDLDGKIDTVKGRLRTTFPSVPDAPISRFVLTLDGGAKGLLISAVNLCGAPSETIAKLIGQNGAVENQNQKLQLPCGRKSPLAVTSEPNCATADCRVVDEKDMEKAKNDGCRGPGPDCRQIGSEIGAAAMRGRYLFRIEIGAAVLLGLALIFGLQSNGGCRSP